MGLSFAGVRRESGTLGDMRKVMKVMERNIEVEMSRLKENRTGGLRDASFGSKADKAAGVL